MIPHKLFTTQDCGSRTGAYMKNNEGQRTAMKIDEDQ